MADVDRCVHCGEIIPEGRMACPKCSQEDNYTRTYDETLCPLMFNTSAPWCKGATCAWWDEDSQKCSIAVLAKKARKQ